MFFICEVFAALKTFFFFTVFTDGILGRTLKYFCLLQKQNIFLQKCYSTQSTNMNKRIRQKCFSEILFSVSDQVKKRKIKRLLLFFSSVYFDPNILSRVFKTKSIKLKKTFFFTAAKNIFFLSCFFLVWHEKILGNVSLKPFFCQTRWQQFKK